MSRKSASRRLKAFGLIVFLFFFIVTAVLAAFSWKVWQDRAKGEIPGFFGYKVAAVEDSSMEPQMTKGSGVFFKPFYEGDQEIFAVQDVLVLKLEENGPLSVKRVIEVASEGSDELLYCLKGDAEKNSVWVLPEDVVGKVTYNLPYMGNLLNLIRTSQGLIYLILIPCGIFLVLEIILLTAAVIAGKKEKKLALSLAPLPDDKDEHFVDVTAQYMGRSGVKLQNFLAQKQEPGPFAKQAADEEKFAKLDYNPLKDRPPMTVRSLQQEKQEAAKAQAAKNQESVERVTINTRDAVAPAAKQNTGDAKRLTMLVDGSEAAELPLTPGQNFKLKAGDYTVEISINPDESK